MNLSFFFGVYTSISYVCSIQYELNIWGVSFHIVRMNLAFFFFFLFLKLEWMEKDISPQQPHPGLNRVNQTGPRGVLLNELLYKLQPFVLYGIHLSNRYCCWCQSNLFRVGCSFYFIDMTFVTYVLFPMFCSFLLVSRTFPIILEIRVFILNFHLRFLVSFLVLEITCLQFLK